MFDYFCILHSVWFPAPCQQLYEDTSNDLSSVQNMPLCFLIFAFVMDFAAKTEQKQQKQAHLLIDIMYQVLMSVYKK